MKRLLIFLLLIVSARIVNAQHADQYSEYMFNSLVLNPAYAGANKVLSVTLLHRDQWTGFDGAPKTTSFSAHTALKNKKINVGLSLISNRYGITEKNTLSLIYAYRIKLGKGSFSFGVQGGIEIIKDHWDRIQTTNSGDKVFTGQQERSTVPVGGFGIYYRSETFYSGISSPTLIKTGTDAKNNYRPLFFTAGKVFSYSEDLKFKPSVLIKYIHNSPVQVDLNITSYYKSFGLGFSYRTNDAVVFLLHFSVNDQFSVGYSYDQTISKLKTYNRGSHELMLKYEFGYKVNANSPRYF